MLKSGALLKLMGALFFASKILAILCILVFLISYALSSCKWLETLCAAPPFGDFNVRPLVQLSRVRVRKSRKLLKPLKLLLLMQRSSLPRILAFTSFKLKGTHCWSSRSCETTEHPLLYMDILWKRQKSCQDLYKGLILSILRGRTTI